MPPINLTAIFIILFMLFGLPMAVTDNPEWRHFWAGLCLLSLAGFCASATRDTLASGQIRIYSTVYKRATQPGAYWANIVLLLFSCVGASITGIWFLFLEIN